MRSAFVQAERFLTLAAFAGVLLATIGIALAASAYAEHHEQTVAVLRTLGLTGAETRFVLALEIALLALLAAVIGNTLAWLVHAALLARLLPGAGITFATPPVSVFLHGAWVALVVLVGFALPALSRLTRLPVVGVLHRDRAALPAHGLRSAAIMILATALIAPWHVDDARLVALAFAGMMAAALVLALTALVIVRLLGRLRARTRMSWRFGLASVARRARLSVVQTTAIGLGLAVILLLALVRTDLLGQWQARLPADAPNQFLINIQGDEAAAMQAFLREQAGVAATFYPMVRGRLTAIGDHAVSPDDYADPRSRRLADREFNLSWATQMKADNRLVGGHWWDPGA
ncbi:MAG: FtsX-like permease family protein, partial [Gammaproteobacteria bacterium]